ncbi:24217_t:CDS:1, partial [Cetraspora pellucida]
ETFVRCERFEDREDYIRKRLLDLGLDLPNLPVYVKFDLRHGYSIGSSAKNKNHKIEQTFLIERHYFKFTLNVDKLQLSQAFKNVINMLSHKYDKNDKNNVEMWINFFEQNGTRVVQSVWVGGYCSITVKNDSSIINAQNNKLIMAAIQARIFDPQMQFELYDETEEFNI